MSPSSGFAHVKKSFRTQRVMKLLGASILSVRRGVVSLSMRNRPAFSQQDGYAHAGILTTLMDSAGGYATLSMLPQGSRVLTVEFKINFTRPAIGETIRAKGRVRKLGRTIAVCELEADAKRDGKWKSCAWGSQTIYCITPENNRPMERREVSP
jgi:uncharacterized protein (TIGR00369 family)